MADNPEQQLDDMAEAISEVLDLLRVVVAHLPIPIGMPYLQVGSSAEDINEGIERLRTLIEQEPIAESAMAHLDQAILGILMAIDVLHIALHDDIRWRVEGVFMICTTAAINLRLVQLLIRGEKA